MVHGSWFMVHASWPRKGPIFGSGAAAPPGGGSGPAAAAFSWPYQTRLRRFLCMAVVVGECFFFCPRQEKTVICKQCKPWSYIVVERSAQTLTCHKCTTELEAHSCLLRDSVVCILPGCLEAAWRFCLGSIHVDVCEISNHLSKLTVDF